MSDEYGLDLAFSSATTAVNSEVAMVAAFGFCSNLLGGGWSEDGQKAEKVTGGGTFYFAAYDIAPTPGAVFEIKVDFGKVGSLTPFVDKAGEQIKSPIVVDNASGLTYVGAAEKSAGCNVVGTKWLAGPYTLVTFSGIYECTVTVALQGSAKTDMVFSVDPEVVVEGGGQGPSESY